MRSFEASLSYILKFVYTCVCLCVFTAVNILPVCSLSSESQWWRAETAEGEAYILLLAVEENQGEEMKGTPLISYTSNLAHWLSSQPWQVCVFVCVCALMAGWVHVCVFLYILNLLRISLHGCTSYLRSVVIFAQSAVELFSEYQRDIIRLGMGFDLSGPSHTQCLVQCSSSLPGRWRETQ